MGKSQGEDSDHLWDLVFRGSPLMAAIALTVLNHRYGGEILERLRGGMDGVSNPKRSFENWNATLCRGVRGHER